MYDERISHALEVCDRSCGGIFLLIDELRDLFEHLSEREAPALQAWPSIEDRLKSRDIFLSDLVEALNISNPWQHYPFPYPRPWPSDTPPVQFSAVDILEGFGREIRTSLRRHEKRLDRVLMVWSESCGGIFTIMDEGRELLETLQDQAPGLLHRQGLLEYRLLIQDIFFTDLIQALKLNNPYNSLHFMYPRPWPGHRFINQEGNMDKEEDKKYLEAAAREVERQMAENPDIAIPVDPDVAGYMGAMASEEDLSDVLTADDLEAWAEEDKLIEGQDKHER